MAVLSRLVGLALVIGCVVWVCSATGMHVAVLFDWQAMLLMLGLWAGAMMMSFGLLGSVRAFAAAFGGTAIADATTATQYLNVLDRAPQAAWAAGLLAFLLSFIAMVMNLADPSTIGSALMLGVMPILYAVVLAEFIVGPLKHAMAWRNPKVAAQLAQSGTTGFIAVGLAMVALTLMVAVVMFYGASQREPALSDALPPVRAVAPQHSSSDGDAIEQRLSEEMQEQGDAGVTLTE